MRCSIQFSGGWRSIPWTGSPAVEPIGRYPTPSSMRRVCFMLQRALTLLFRAVVRGFDPRGGAQPEDHRHLRPVCRRWQSGALAAKTASRRCFCGPNAYAVAKDRNPQTASRRRDYRGTAPSRREPGRSGGAPASLDWQRVHSGGHASATRWLSCRTTTHSTVFAPNVVQSKLLQRRGDSFKVFLRFYMKKMIAVTLNTEHEAQFTIVGPDRAYSSITAPASRRWKMRGRPRSTKTPPNTGHGFMWRLDTYWRFVERDGGTYVQCESITLSRDVPFGLGWLIKSFVTEVPRDSLSFMLERVRHSLVTH